MNQTRIKENVNQTCRMLTKLASDICWHAFDSAYLSFFHRQKIIAGFYKSYIIVAEKYLLTKFFLSELKSKFIC